MNSATGEVTFTSPVARGSTTFIGNGSQTPPPPPTPPERPSPSSRRVSFFYLHFREFVSLFKNLLFNRRFVTVARPSWSQAAAEAKV
jgi:hypothetical protein